MLAQLSIPDALTCEGQIQFEDAGLRSWIAAKAG